MGAFLAVDNPVGVCHLKAVARAAERVEHFPRAGHPGLRAKALVLHYSAARALHPDVAANPLVEQQQRGRAKNHGQSAAWQGSSDTAAAFCSPVETIARGDIF